MPGTLAFARSRRRLYTSAIATTSTPWTERICPNKSFPRSPTPIMPMRIRSFAPSTQAVGYASRAAVPRAACCRNVRLDCSLIVPLSPRGFPRVLQCVGLLQKFLHSRPTPAGRFFRRATTTPVSLQTHGVLEAVAHERFELCRPINDSATHRRPVVFLPVLDHIFAVTVTNALLGQPIVAVRIWSFAAGGGVARIPIQHERAGLHLVQNFSGFDPGRRVAGGFIFEQ